MNGSKQQASLDRALLGDVEARGQLLETFRPYIRVMVRGLRDGKLQARLDDSDLIQDALLEAHRAFPSFRGTTLAEVTAWMRQIVLGTVSHALRRHLGTARRDLGREQPLTEDVAIRNQTPAEQAIRAEQAARMAQALAQLPEDMQQVLLGRHMDNLPYAELAQRLQRSEGAVRILYTRAVRRLREACQSPGEGEP
jgi:RNA polymerase sigma-70 factor (ECF subfamily)